ncbi:MAG: helix-hairpin-helix domain-containing protein [Thermoanaerobaculia bacterium]|nr:helix-hairpin-helix domain-containing protein [Thermoanaerobaculia bacterium]
MRKSLINIVTVVVMIFGALGAFAAEESAPAKVAGVVNINSADASQIAYLPRIGEKTADRVVAWRKENGQFKKATDLMQVKGISDKTFDLVAPYVVLEGKTTLSAKQKAPRAKKSSTAAQPSTTAH